MTPLCPSCGQPLPDQPRRDPPLPQLDAPAVVTIHDLPEEARAKADVEVVNTGWGPFRRLRTARDVVDQRGAGDGR